MESDPVSKTTAEAFNYPHMLRTSYEQADTDGVMVLASRQLLHEAADEIERLTDAMKYLDQQFAVEMTVCPRCAHSYPTEGCDSHLYIREVLNHGK